MDNDFLETFLRWVLTSANRRSSMTNYWAPSLFNFWLRSKQLQTVLLSVLCLERCQHFSQRKVSKINSAIHQNQLYFQVFAYFSSKSWLFMALALFWREVLGQLGPCRSMTILRSSIRCVCPVVQRCLTFEPVIERKGFNGRTLVFEGIVGRWSGSEAAETIDFFRSSWCLAPELLSGNV